jgi:hypothetical protein
VGTNRFQTIPWLQNVSVRRHWLGPQEAGRAGGTENTGQVFRDQGSRTHSFMGVHGQSTTLPATPTSMYPSAHRLIYSLHHLSLSRTKANMHSCWSRPEWFCPLIGAAGVNGVSWESHYWGHHFKKATQEQGHLAPGRKLY